MTEEQNRTLNDKFMLRLPDGMRDRIKAAAADNNRSMNAEIVSTLEEKYPKPLPNAEIVELIDRALAVIPKHVLEDFIFSTMEKEGVTEQDIKDGLMPGVTLIDSTSDGAPTPHQSEPVVDPTAGSGAFTLDAIAQRSEKQSKSKPKGRGLGAAPGEGRSLRPQGRSLRDALPKEEKSPPPKGRSIIDKPKPDSSTD
ncbi:hypothetical protein NBRC116598_21420 [Pseudophaeobacter arcticus]|uniref:Arc-like DNA binding domain-containing protein n=1 Tax=Pseudophaeobacter arcticus TaxID=385492 RepID=A0ABQ0ALE6_9RHOB